MRDIPAPLLAHLQQSGTTTTRLLKISATNGMVFGLSMLDQDIDYDDGDGEIRYFATRGFDPSAIRTDIGLSVDNSEGTALLAEAVTSDEIPGLEEEMIESGILDDAQWVCYLINFRDHSMGHAILDAGDIGQVRTRWGMLWIPELLSYVSRLKQPIGHVWSIRCRAIFGTPADSQTGCGVDAEALWDTGTVSASGPETNREFEGDVPATFPGRVQFLTGQNAGRIYSVEATNSGAAIILSETTPYPIGVGDSYRARPDCAKRYQLDCIDIWDNGVNFKGEPTIPTGDSAAVQTPGAQVPGYTGTRWRAG